MIAMAESTCTTISNVVNQVMKTPRVFLDAGSRADGKEIGGGERCAADETAIDVLLRKQFAGIGGFHAPAVEDAQAGGRGAVVPRHLRAQRMVHLLRLRRSGVAAGADRPNGFVGERAARQAVGADRV